jgi:glycerophosphoryl diester phosphodiesterase
MINIAHRGASGHAPEHTIAAFDMAWEWGVDYIEQDLQMTADGVLVVMHDDTLDRTVRGPAELCTGPVIERTLAELRQCDAGLWFNQRYPDRARPEFVGQKVPTLEQLFQRYGERANYYIETKNPESAPGMEEKLLELLERYRLRAGAVERRQVMIQSFSEASLRKIHELDAELPLVRLLEGHTAVQEPGTDLSAELRPQLEGIAEYAVAIGVSRFSVDLPLVRKAKSHGMEVHAYTVNLRLEMERLWNLGVEGIFTDFPDRLREMQRARGGTPPARQQPID